MECKYTTEQTYCAVKWKKRDCGNLHTFDCHFPVIMRVMSLILVSQCIRQVVTVALIWPCLNCSKCKYDKRKNVVLLLGCIYRDYIVFYRDYFWMPLLHVNYSSLERMAKDKCPKTERS